VEFPVASPHVLAVGGTSLTTSSSPRGWVEGAWSGAGSGCSNFEPKPSYQTDNGCSQRTVADVAAVADPNTGVAVFDSFGVTPGWYVFGGTSVSAPLVGAIYAVTGLASVGPGFAYSQPGDFFDVTNGSNGTCSPAYLCTAQAGYDGPTGLGSPNGVALAGVGGGGTDGGLDAGTPDAGTDAGTGAGTCAHPECTPGGPLTPSCSSCASAVCSHDPFCCNVAWDSICVSEVPTFCGSTFCTGGGTPTDAGTPDAGTPDAGTPDAGTPDAGTPDAGTADGGTGSTCSHPLCTTGGPLTPTCDPCAGKICGADPFCCNSAWDSICVSEVPTFCGTTCP